MKKSIKIVEKKSVEKSIKISAKPFVEILKKKSAKKKYSKILKNSGQAVVESILLMSILLGVISIVIKGFKDNQIIQNLISAPWKKIDNVIQSGDISKNPVHPNSISRHSSLKPQ